MSGLILPRRTLLAAGLAMPFVKTAAAQAGEVIIRNPGGVYDDVMRKYVYDPFTQATGIKVTAVAATAAKLLAMFRANNVELDVIDAGDSILEQLRRQNALAPLDYGNWRWTKPDDIPAEVRLPTRAANMLYGSVLAYSKEAFPDGRHPKSWAEFWDATKFPGPRSLADMATGNPYLEFALLADGVPKDKLYPIDIDRAFRAMGRIRPQIRKFWDTGALSAQMMADKEVVLAGLWNGRVQVLMDRGAPLGIEWNENMIEVQAVGIFKDAKNVAGGQKLIDFMLQPEAQAGYCRDLTYGPTNKQAFALLPAEQLTRMPGSPASADKGFYKNIAWWEDNRDRVNRQWSRWILG
ncbi:ABC transporter substrate-binding protein [Siccirubricoccus phaeus]|uniref:ABC transporter substrate-binding protein n=1 Tax=Siccirubricoccus phaeus TaxID=2595053 RepID=UPI0011F257BA|nr:ABC transporter substrate-binding protein [Siccirubricoccus phaeus]